MQSMKVSAGSTIFVTGMPSEAVYIIESGTVSITVEGQEVARLSSGELFGESGVLEKRPRSADAIAATDCTLLTTPADAFLAAFGMDNQKALALVRMICRRLRDTTHRAARPANPPPAPEDAFIRLLPDHPLLIGSYGITSCAVTHLPFQVGNRYGGEAMAIDSNHSWTIQAHGSAELSAPHFEITRRNGHLGIHDLGSAKGTLVNGVRLGGGGSLRDPFAPLHEGDNQVTAGNAHSPFRFRVQVLPRVATPPPSLHR